MTDTKKRTWVSIAIAAAIIVVVLGLAAVGGTAFWVSRHVNTRVTSTETASEEFTQRRARFMGQQPLIEIQEGREPIVHRPAPGSSAAASAESAGRHQELRPMLGLHALVYDPDDQKLVHIDIPFWLLKLAPSKRFSFLDSNVDFDSDRVRLTLENIERHGPGLILDHAGRRGGQILVWTE